MEYKQKIVSRLICDALDQQDALRGLSVGEEAVRTHHRTVLSPPRWICEFQWREVRQRLPENQVLLGVILAVTVNRIAKVPPPPSIGDPVPVRIEDGPDCGLPWKALSMFTAVSFNGELGVDAGSFEKSIKNTAANLVQIYTRPHNSNTE